MTLTFREQEEHGWCLSTKHFDRSLDTLGDLSG